MANSILHYYISSNGNILKVWFIKLNELDEEYACGLIGYTTDVEICPVIPEVSENIYKTIRQQYLDL